MAAPTNTKKKASLPVASILVEHLRIGDNLATHTQERAEGVFAVKTTKVTQIDECPGQWRTHIHVNKNMCYDLRQYVYIAR